jgi:hypothetical protein
MSTVVGETPWVAGSVLTDECIIFITLIQSFSYLAIRSQWVNWGFNY